MNVTGHTLEMRLVNDTLYLRLPGDEAETGGKPWAKVSGDDPIAKALGATLDQAKQNDPSKFLDQIQQAGTITKSEQTMLDGQQVSHYWVDLDLAKAASTFQAQGLTSDQIQKLTAQVKTIPMQVWLDRDELPVQLSQDLSGIMKANGAPADAQNLTVSIKYTGWGTPVDIQAPPADQVGELTPN